MTTSYGRYRVERQIGQGGMGVVHLATDTVLQRPAALKVVTDVLAGNEEFRARFAHEAEALARLDSPHVIQIFDHGEQDGVPYIATQYVAGGDLGMLLSQRGPMPYAVAASVCAQVADALHDAHLIGIVHRDVKATNVLVRDPAAADLFVYLCDFGIAKSDDSDGMTRPGGVAGTWAYLSPERADGSPATPSSDIYAVGCLLWTCLTGAPPYAGTEPQVILAHQQAPVPRLGGDEPTTAQLNHVLARALAKDPAQRYADAAALRADLLAVARTGSSTTAPAPPPLAVTQTRGPGSPPPASSPPGAPPATSRPRSRTRLAAVLVATAVVLAGGVAAGVALTGGGGDDPTPGPTSAAPTSDTTDTTDTTDTAVTGDVTGDGKGDVVMSQYRADSGNPLSILTFPSTGLSLGAAQASPLSSRGFLHVADVDGDGRSDLVTDLGSSIEEAFTIVVRPGDGSAEWTQEIPTPYDVFGTFSFAYLADADGDGLDDVILTANGGDGRRSALYVARAGDGEFGELEQWYAGTDDWVAAEFFSGDYDGDGLSDLLVSTSVAGGTGGELWTIFTSDGSAFAAGTGYPLPSGGPVAGTPLPGDVDGDGADEIVLLGGAGRAVTVFEVAGGGVTDKRVWARGLDDGEKGATITNTYNDYTVSDLDGDGDDDLVWLQPDRTFAALVSDGSALADPVPWGTLDCGEECGDRFNFAQID